MDTRRVDSPIERKLLDSFDRLGLKPLYQHRIGIFRVDFAFPGIKLAVECDGHWYHTSESQRARDRYRQSKIREQGWVFERFQGWLIYRHSLACASKIALKYFPDKIGEKAKKLAIGSMVTMYARTNP